VLVTSGFNSQRHSSSVFGSVSADYQSLVPLVVDSRSSPENPGIGGSLWNSFLPLERMPFDDQRSDFSISISIFHDLMESGGDNGVTMIPQSPQQQIVWSIDVNHIARHLRSQVPNLILEFDLPHWARTIGIKTIISGLGGAQSVSGDSQVMHDPTRHIA